MKIFSIVSKVVGLLLFVGILVAGFIIPDKLINDYINEEDTTMDGYVPGLNGGNNNNDSNDDTDGGNDDQPGYDIPDLPGEGGSDSSDDKEDETKPVAIHTVFLTTDMHCTVVSANPAIVMDGQDAEFTVVFESNYIVDSIDGGEYIGGKVVVKGCVSDRIISLVTKQKNVYYNFDYETPNEKDGTVTCAAKPGRLLGNQTITLIANPAETAEFLGWSINGTVVNGGTMVSYSPTYSFLLKEDVKLYPNFLKEGYAIVKYNLNGGYLAADANTTVIVEQYNLKTKPCVNLLGDVGTITRAGHTLLEYTTEQNGGGTATNPGGVAKIPESGILEVWAQWSEWNPEVEFNYTVNSGKVTITKFLGDGPVLSIPAYIEGMPVTTINAGAVQNCNFTTIVFPNTIRTVASGAVSGCPNLEKVYMFDTVTAFSDDWATNSKKYTTLCLNAGMAPNYVVNAESVATRFEYLLTRNPNKPVIMCVGGSSCLYGVYSPVLEELLNYEYYVINAGTNAGGTGVLYMEALVNFMQPGDIIVNVPEYNANQNGGLDIVWRTFRATESCYNIYRYVDISKYTHFFSALSEFNTSSEARLNAKAKNYHTTNTSLTIPNCDLSGERFFQNQTWGTTGVSANYFTTARINTINNLIYHVNSKGVKFYYSVAPAYSNDSNPSQANCNAYYNKAVEVLECPVISNPWNYRFFYDDYNNSSYHLHTAAAKERTRRLAGDIQAQFDKEN